MSMPETVVAALALALTSLALLRVLAQNGQGQRLLVSLKIELISWPGAGISSGQTQAQAEMLGYNPETK